MIKGVIDILESTEARFSEKIAFKDAKGEISFGGLLDLAQRIGSGLAKSYSAGYSRPILVMVDRRLEPLVAFMGIQYSGNFYVPVDNKTPENRLKAIADVMDPIAAIGFNKVDAAKISKVLPNLSYHKYAELCEEEIDIVRLRSIREASLDTDPVYTIFTSGSTGVPKGVTISQRSVLDLSSWLTETFQFDEADVLGNQTPFYFDASVKDIYICLRTGACLYILPSKCFLFPKLLAETLIEERVSAILWATSAVVLTAKSGILSEVEFPDLKKVFFAGEAMFSQHLNIWRANHPNCEYINIYGPTEITVDCTYYPVKREFTNDEVVPIGYSCENKQIFLLDEHGLPVKTGDTGEIAVRGTGLALGYYNNPEQTRKVFVQNPLHSHYQDLIYKTGDNGRLNEHGEIEFVGRSDFQIKHMGNRIELGEIEAAFYTISEVQQLVVSYDRAKEEIKLFYTAEEEISPKVFLNHAALSLPKYMFPSKFVRLDAMPMNANGKIDRNKINTGMNA